MQQGSHLGGRERGRGRGRGKEREGGGRGEEKADTSN